MDISSNSLQHLVDWRDELIDIVRGDEDKWEELYPLYSMINFWIYHKKRESRIQSLLLNRRQLSVMEN